jgi:glucose dehydrogenase
LEANWQYVNHDANGTNYNPQNQINAGNAANLQVQWVFPYPGSEATAPGLKNIAFTAGAADPPLVVNGIVYSMTNNMILYALSAKTGSLIWQYQYSVNWTAASQTIPLAPAGGHIHGINYLPASNGQPAVISFTGMICDINGVDAITGKLAWSIGNICSNVPGNPPGYLYRGYQDSHPPNVYVKGANGDGIVITAEAGAAPGLFKAARAFMTGYDYKTGQLLWRTMTQPERPGGNTSFALQYCDVGYIQGVPCTQIISNPAIKTLFQNDWINPKTGQIAYNSGSSGVWGFYPIDQSRGIVIMGTSQASPDFNGSLRPGPNLYAATLFGLNATNGKVLWYFQTTTHDIWDYDCSWNGQISTISVNGANHNAYIKTCKNGYLYVLDEMTGKPYYYGSLPGIKGRGAPPATPGGYESLGDPTDPITYVRAFATQKTPGGPTPSFIGNGMNIAFVESDHAFDGKYVFVGTHNHPANVSINCADPKPGCTGQGATTVQLLKLPQNSTFSAVDPVTGKVAWSAFLPLPFRGGVTVTGTGSSEILLVPEFDGNLYIFNANNGQLVTQKYLGSNMDVQCTVGATTEGVEQIYLQVGGGGATGGILSYTSTPGVLVALGLPAGAVGASTTSSAAASVSVSTTTVTPAGNPSAGVDLTTFYAVSGVAVIGIVAAIVLGIRGRSKT